MILYQALSKPYYDPAYERYCFEAKIGDGSPGHIVKDDIMFETEKEAWAVYHRSNNSFEFLDREDILRITSDCREGKI